MIGWLDYKYTRVFNRNDNNTRININKLSNEIIENNTLCLLEFTKQFS